MKERRASAHNLSRKTFRTVRAGVAPLFPLTQKPMHIEDLDEDTLWRCYQRGYHCMIRSGLYFRQLVRPALSHVYFQRAMPILVVYSRANHGDNDLPPGFSDQMDACPLTLRDLLHLDYAISLGYSEELGGTVGRSFGGPVMPWPGPTGSGGVFIAADAVISTPEPDLADLYDMDDDDLDDDEDDGGPPFDL